VQKENNATETKIYIVPCDECEAELSYREVVYFFFRLSFFKGYTVEKRILHIGYAIT